jgi:hypothetical protein
MNDPISVQTQDISESMNFFEEEYENEEYENEEYDNDVTFEYDYEALERIYAGFEPSEEEEEDDDAKFSSYLDTPSTMISNEEADFLLSQEQNKEYSTCVLIDLIDGKIQTCGSDKQMKPLTQLIGMWRLDKDAVKKAQKENERLGICMKHFNFDQRQHGNKVKSTKPITNDDYLKARCLFCNKIIFFFCRGGYCNLHSWSIQDKNIQVPCNGQVTCHALDDYGKICKTSFEVVRARHVCCECYQEHGGHLHVKMGTGKSKFDCTDLHKDHSSYLELLANWLLNVAKCENKMFKEKVTKTLLDPILQIIGETNDEQEPFLQTKISSSNMETESSTESDLIYTRFPSLFVLHVFFKMNDLTAELNNEHSRRFGQNMANTLWKSRNILLEQQKKIKMPDSLQDYYEAFPRFLTCFFDGLLTEIYRKKLKVSNIKLQKKNKKQKELDTLTIRKITTFFVSIIVHITFPYMGVWFPNVLASLSRRPKLLGSFQNLLSTLNIIAHTSYSERRLEKKRMCGVKPELRLQKNPNIWNLAIIDNIDFKEKSFSYGNIFDVTRKTSHKTLRMTFQIPLSFNIEEGIDDMRQNISEKDLFGMNNTANAIIDLFDKLLDETLQIKIENETINYQKDFDALTIHQKMLENIPHGCKGPAANIIILEPGGVPSTDDGIFDSVNMYYKDYGIKEDDYLDIVADESIFSRLIKYRRQHPNLRPLLGQWHTSKDMCSVLITIFSSYGIFDLATILGVKYLDKLESVVDYRSTVRVLELIWSAVGISIRVWLKSKNMNKNQILDGDFNKNMILKIWFLYYEWTGIFIAHRLGIRTGNFNLQKHCLEAFSPLFPVAGKINYMKSVAHYLTILAQYPKLEERLHASASLKISEDRAGHLFSFDEGLEEEGVKFIKNHIVGNVVDEENLKIQIKAAQSEHERIGVLFAEYLNDTTLSHGNRAVKTHKEAMWNLVSHLLEAFNIADEHALEYSLWNVTKPSELNASGVQRLYNCYVNGCERMYSICRQEVLGTEEINTTGRRLLNISRTKIKTLKENKKGTKSKLTSVITPSEQPRLITTALSIDVPEQLHQRPVRRETTSKAKGILNPLICKRKEITDEEILNILPNLNEDAASNNIWDVERVRRYLSRHAPNKKQENA